MAFSRVIDDDAADPESPLRMWQLRVALPFQIPSAVSVVGDFREIAARLEVTDT